MKYIKFKVINFSMQGVGSNYLVLHPVTAEENELSPGTLLVTQVDNLGFRLIVSPSVDIDFAGVSTERLEQSKLKEGSEIEVIPAGLEGITRIIKRKMKGEQLLQKEIETFMGALDAGLLTKSHVASFGTAVEIKGMHGEEITAVAKSILQYSKKFNHKGKTVVDKHSIGGIAGNRITPIMIPTIAACGLTIPKVSTRAITSPAGTVDALEVVMPVDLSFEEASEVLEKTNGCMVNGETVGLGSVADKFLDAVSEVKIDPKEMMIASILAKKKAAGADFVLIDLPTGKGSKLPSREAARLLAYDFSRIGNSLGQKIECVISPGDRPIGSMVGPSLEMTEVMRILENKPAEHSLKRKAVSLAGLILESSKFAKHGEGEQLAREVIESGKALAKFKEIVEAQGGDPSITSDTIPTAPYSHTVKAEKTDTVYSLDSYNIGSMARMAGAPKDHTAGVLLYVDRGDTIKVGDPILEIRSHSERRINDALSLMRTAPPIVLEQSILEHITGIKDN